MKEIFEEVWNWFKSNSTYYYMSVKIYYILSVISCSVSLINVYIYNKYNWKNLSNKHLSSIQELCKKV